VAIYYLNPRNENVPFGGVKKIYDHVRTLNDAGFSAAVVQARAKSRPTWFHSEGVPLVQAPLTVSSADLLVIPECYGEKLRTIAPGVPRISLNQSPHYTFLPIRFFAPHPYSVTSDLLGVLAVSDNLTSVLAYAFPQLRVWRFVASVDTEVFSQRSGGRQRRICYVPGKRHGSITAVFSILTARGVLRGWEVQALQGLSEAGIARALSTAAVFLSFPLEWEGFGLPPLEAMACGAIVVGYTGFGAMEFMSEQTSVTIPEGDVLRYAQTLEEVLVNWDDQQARWAAMRANARSMVEQRYSPAAERASLIDAYAEILDAASRGSSGARVTRQVSRADTLSERGRLHRAARTALRRAKNKASQALSRRSVN
jgi:hypothetical protein